MGDGYILFIDFSFGLKWQTCLKLNHFYKTDGITALIDGPFGLCRGPPATLAAIGCA